MGDNHSLCFTFYWRYFKW